MRVHHGFNMIDQWFWSIPYAMFTDKVIVSWHAAWVFRTNITAFSCWAVGMQLATPLKALEVKQT